MRWDVHPESLKVLYHIRYSGYSGITDRQTPRTHEALPHQVGPGRNQIGPRRPTSRSSQQQCGLVSEARKAGQGDRRGWAAGGLRRGAWLQAPGISMVDEAAAVAIRSAALGTRAARSRSWRVDGARRAGLRRPRLRRSFAPVNRRRGRAGMRADHLGPDAVVRPGSKAGLSAHLTVGRYAPSATCPFVQDFPFVPARDAPVRVALRDGRPLDVNSAARYSM